MASNRPLRGGCHCGRNRYLIHRPEGATETPQVIFNTEAHHHVPLGSPLAVYIRVPLLWFEGTTYAVFADESPSMIRRVYSHPEEAHTQRQFCGFCGTPLSYWSEEPRTEADYISLTLGSLDSDDLYNLDTLGLLPEVEEPETPSPSGASTTVVRRTIGVPWFEQMMEGSDIRRLARTRRIGHRNTKEATVDWEVTEWDEEETLTPDVLNGEEDVDMNNSGKGKRKHQD